MSNAEQPMQAALVFVYRRCDVYCTGVRQGRTGTSAVSAEAAARDLAARIFGDRPHRVTFMGHPARADVDIFELRVLMSDRASNVRANRPSGAAQE